MFQRDAEATRIYLHPALPSRGRPVIGGAAGLLSTGRHTPSDHPPGLGFGVWGLGFSWVVKIELQKS